MLTIVPSIKILTFDVPPNTPSSQFFSSFLSLVLVSPLVSSLSSAFLQTFINIPLPKIHKIDCSRIYLPHVQNERSHNAREASILGSKKKSVHFVFGDFSLSIMLNVHVFGTKSRSEHVHYNRDFKL